MNPTFHATQNAPENQNAREGLDTLAAPARLQAQDNLADPDTLAALEVQVNPTFPLAHEAPANQNAL